MDGPERRATRRFKLREAFAVLRIEGTDPADNRIVKLSEVSAGGAMVTGWSNFKAGDAVRLVVNLPILGMECTADVVWVRATAGSGRTPNSSWLAGVRFRSLSASARAQVDLLAANPLLAIAAHGASLMRRQLDGGKAVPVRESALA